MENVWLILAVCAISAGYIVFELQALGNKLQLYEHNLSELKNQQSVERKENEHIWNTISRLEKQIEDLRVEFKTQNDQEKTKNEDFQKELIRLDWHLKDSTGDLTSKLNGERKETEDFRKELVRLDLQVKYLSGEFTSQLNREKINNVDLQREIDRLQNKQEVTKIKMEKLNTDIKNRDDILKDLDKKANSLHDVLQNTVNEMEKLLGQVASMDDQILDLRDRITTLSRNQEDYYNDYSGGRSILDSIKAGLSAIASKLFEYAIWAKEALDFKVKRLLN